MPRGLPRGASLQNFLCIPDFYAHISVHPINIAMPFLTEEVLSVGNSRREIQYLFPNVHRFNKLKNV
jgi:hypothetical protein